MEKKMVGGEKTSQPNSSHWWWMLCENLKGYPLKMAYEGGHRRWGIENKAFNELTQHYHLERCYHHEGVAMLAQMLILMLGFVLFSAYAPLHSQRVRTEQITMKELAHDLDLALEEALAWDQWFACGELARGTALLGNCSLTICGSKKEVEGTPGEVSSRASQAFVANHQTNCHGL